MAALSYQWSGDTLYNNLRDYDLGTVVDFDSAGSLTALLNHGLWGRRLIVGQEFSWLSPDGQDAQVKLTYERMTPGTVVAGATSYNACLNVNTVSWDHTVAAGNNRLMVLTLSKRAFTTAAITTVTYDGVPLTKLTQANLGTGDFAQVEIWYLLNPAVGLKYITINLSGPDSMQFGCTNFTNVDLSRPFGTPVLASGMTGPARVTVPASPNEFALDVVGFCHINTKPVAHSGQTQLWNITADDNLKGAASCKPGAGLTVMGWDNVNNPWVQVGVTIRGE